MRKLFSLVAVLSVLALAASSAPAQNLLTNGTLDAVAVSSQLGNTPTNWDVTASGAIIGPFNDGAASENFAGGAPTPNTNDPNTPANEDFGLFFKAFTGNTTRGPVTVHVTQDNAATPGLFYTLSGWAGGEPNFQAAGTEFAVEFLDIGSNVIGGTTLPLTNLLVDNGLPFDYKQYSVVGRAPAGAAGVRARISMIDGIPNPAGGGQAFVVDDFTLTSSPVPEPSALGLAGLALAGLAAKRRRK